LEEEWAVKAVSDLIAYLEEHMADVKRIIAVIKSGR
jgi:hypothetical protein